MTKPIGGTFGGEIILTPKRGKFSASHSITCLGPDSRCARCHGHTWWVQATFAGKPDERGLLIDYAVVDAIAGLFDHENQNVLPLLGGREPTGEVLLLTLVRLFDERCEASPATIVRVRLDEDPIPGDSHMMTWTRPGWDGRLP